MGLGERKHRARHPPRTIAAANQLERSVYKNISMPCPVVVRHRGRGTEAERQRGTVA